MRYLHKIIASLAISIGTQLPCHSQEKTFVREYTYKASEMDSKISSRAVALNEIRAELLNEVGVYVQSEQILTTAETNGKQPQSLRETISTITGAMTKIDLIDESWNGETYWIKASITVDLKSLSESIDAMMKDAQRVKDLEYTKTQLDKVSAELRRLKEELNTNSQTANRTTLQSAYTTESNKLIAGNFMRTGQMKYSLNNISGAISDFTKAIEKNPYYADAYYNRAVSKKELNQLAEAMADFNKAIELNPKFTNALNYRGILKSSLGDHRGAIQDYTTALAIDRTYSIAYYNRGLAKTRLGKYKDSIIDFTFAIEFDPTSHWAYYNRGISEINVRKKKQACIDFSKAGELGSPKAYEAIGKFCR